MSVVNQEVHESINSCTAAEGGVGTSLIAQAKMRETRLVCLRKSPWEIIIQNLIIYFLFEPLQEC